MTTARPALTYPPAAFPAWTRARSQASTAARSNSSPTTDAGSTVARLVAELPLECGLTVVTHSLPVAARLADHVDEVKVEVLDPGGELRMAVEGLLRLGQNVFF